MKSLEEIGRNMDTSLYTNLRLSKQDGNENLFEQIGVEYMKLIFGLGQDLFEQFCSTIKSPFVASDRKTETEFVELLSAALREDHVSSILLHIIHVTLIGKTSK